MTALMFCLNLRRRIDNVRLAYVIRVALVGDDAVSRSILFGKRRGVFDPPLSGLILGGGRSYSRKQQSKEKKGSFHHDTPTPKVDSRVGAGNAPVARPQTLRPSVLVNDESERFSEKMRGAAA